MREQSKNTEVFLLGAHGRERAPSPLAVARLAVRAMGCEADLRMFEDALMVKCAPERSASSSKIDAVRWSVQSFLSPQLAPFPPSP